MKYDSRDQALRTIVNERTLGDDISLKYVCNYFFHFTKDDLMDCLQISQWLLEVFFFLNLYKLRRNIRFLYRRVMSSPCNYVT
jgi:hypothetical protein